MSKESGDFSYMNGDGGRGERYITHDPDGHFAGEFGSIYRAKFACDRWNKFDARLVKMSWNPPSDDAAESDRGTYRISFEGTEWSMVAPGGWHSMEHAAGIAQRLRDCVACHGKVAVAAVLAAIRR